MTDSELDRARAKVRGFTHFLARREAATALRWLSDARRAKTPGRRRQLARYARGAWRVARKIERLELSGIAEQLGGVAS